MDQVMIDRENRFDEAGEDRIFRSLRNFWHPIAYSGDVGEQPVAAQLCGTELVVARIDGEARVFEDLCAHRGSKLSLGRVIDGCQIECPYHGWRYDAEGNCVLAPQRPDLAAHLRAKVKRYNAREEYGLIWACLADEPHYPFPTFAAWDNPRCHHVPVPAPDWACSAARRVENYTDYSHLAIVHDGFLANRDEPEVPDHRVWKEETKLCCEQDSESWTKVPLSDAEALGGWREGEDKFTRYRTDWTVSMPLTVDLTVTLEHGGRYFLLFHPTPLSPKSSRNFTIAARDFGDPERDEEEVAAFEQVIYEQDRPIVESQRPEQLPEDLSEEMHLKGVDSFSISYRRWLLALADELVEEAS